MQAAIVAAAFIGGGVWAIVLTLVIWRIYPDRPAQHAAAEAYRSLAAMVEGLRSLLDDSASDEAAWTQFSRTRIAAVRAAIESARDAMLELQRARGGSGNLLRRGTIRLEAAEQLLGTLIALTDNLEHANERQRAVAQSLLQRLQPPLASLADAITNEGTAAILRLTESIEAIVSAIEALPEPDPVRLIGITLPRDFGSRRHFRSPPIICPAPASAERRPVFASVCWYR